MRSRNLLAAMILSLSLCISSVAQATDISIPEDSSLNTVETSSESEGYSAQGLVEPIQIPVLDRIGRERGVIDEGEYEGIRYRVVVEPAASGLAQPNIKVGAGKFIYLYVNTAEFNGLSTAGGAAYTGVVCGMLMTVTGVGGIACAAVTQGIFAYVRTRDAPGRNQCGEIKLSWVGFGPVGYKVINKPCNKI